MKVEACQRTPNEMDRRHQTTRGTQLDDQSQQQRSVETIMREIVDYDDDDVKKSDDQIFRTIWHKYWKSGQVQKFETVLEYSSHMGTLPKDLNWISSGTDWITKTNSKVDPHDKQDQKGGGGGPSLLHQTWKVDDSSKMAILKFVSTIHEVGDRRYYFSPWKKLKRWKLI